MDYVLAMTFLTSTGDKKTMSIDGVKPTISSAEVNELMNTIISKDVFISKNGSLVDKYSAQLTEKQTTKFTVAE